MAVLSSAAGLKIAVLVTGPGMHEAWHARGLACTGPLDGSFSRGAWHAQGLGGRD